MKYPVYSAYKDSGVEWLGEVPDGWEVKKLKFISSVHPSNVDKKSVPDQPSVFLCNYTDVYYNEQIRGDIPFMKATATKEQIKKFSLLKGDTIITKDSEDPADIAVPTYVPQDLENVVCGYHLAMIRPYENTDGCFLKHVFNSVYAKSVFAIKANGLTRYGLGTYSINNTFFPTPSRSEQITIAHFLDRETTKIDTLISKQQKLISLLQEKRQAVISHAVTKGINPDAKMKDSGIEWLGDVPEHWLKSRLKYVVNQIIDTEHKTVHFVDDGEYLVARTSNIRNGKLITKGAKHTDSDGYSGWTKRGVPKRGDVILTREAPAGEACIVPKTPVVCLGQRTVLIKKAPKVDSKYIVYSIYAGLSQEFIEQLSQGATVVHFNMPDIGNIPLFEIPTQEQVDLIRFLDNTTNKIDNLITKANKMIQFLTERRTALISAAVTGKIDVRNA